MGMSIEGPLILQTTFFESVIGSRVLQFFTYQGSQHLVLVRKETVESR
jgi:hypothetical protein